MKYIKRYNNYDEFAAAETVTAIQEYVSSIEPGIAGIRTDEDSIWYNYAPFDVKMTVEELIAAGYATMSTDHARSASNGSESRYKVIQIHSGCPISLGNITNFDEYLESATTFVWRESLPNGWDAQDLAVKYTETELARPTMVELFDGVEMSGCSAITLSFAGGASYYVTNSSILSNRSNHGELPHHSTPEHVTVILRGEYSSVFQTALGHLRTTKHITFSVPAWPGFNCHDVSGMFEGNDELTGLTFTGGIWYGYNPAPASDPYQESGMLNLTYMFNSDSKLIGIPVLNTGYSRDHQYNWLYPHYWTPGTDRGNASTAGMFRRCTALTSIKPAINMFATKSTLIGNAPDDRNQMFGCPNLTDVHLMNVNNSDWDFTSRDFYIPRMDVASIQYLIDNLSDQQANMHGQLLYWTDSAMTAQTTTVTEYPIRNNFTITFSDLHQSEIAQSYIDAAAAKGWTIAFKHIDLS